MYTRNKQCNAWKMPYLDQRYTHDHLWSMQQKTEFHKQPFLFQFHKGHQLSTKYKYKAHTLKRKIKHFWICLLVFIYKLKDYLLIKILIITYLFPPKTALLNDIFSYCSTNYLNLWEGVLRRGIWLKSPGPHVSGIISCATETKENPVAF